MSDPPRPGSDTLLGAAAIALGVVAAATFSAWRAVAADTGAWAAFAEAAIFPGTLIAVVIAAIVWLGWRANID